MVILYKHRYQDSYRDWSAIQVVFLSRAWPPPPPHVQEGSCSYRVWQAKRTCRAHAVAAIIHQHAFCGYTKRHHIKQVRGLNCMWSPRPFFSARPHRSDIANREIERYLYTINTVVASNHQWWFMHAYVANGGLRVYVRQMMVSNHHLTHHHACPGGILFLRCAYVYTCMHAFTNLSMQLNHVHAPIYIAACLESGVYRMVGYTCTIVTYVDITVCELFS